MFIGIDIGGTNIKAILVNSHGEIKKFSQIETGRNISSIRNGIIKLIDNRPMIHAFGRVVLSLYKFKGFDNDDLEKLPYSYDSIE